MDIARGEAGADEVFVCEDLSVSSRLDGEREAARLAALDRYDVMDTPREEAFDRITRLAERIFDVPIAMIALIDGHRQWFKSSVGLGNDEAARESAFCNIPIVNGATLVVRDAASDPRFAQNAFVVGPPYIRFYAGAPLRSPEGHVVGTLCVVDREPRTFDARQSEILADLVQIVVDQLELRRCARTDALTGAASRGAFRDEAARAARLATRHEHELGLIAFDLDSFKQINDRWGHAAGDVVLKRSIAACQRELRASDLLGRLGGEEFAVLLPYTDPDAALQVAERLRAAIAAETYGASDGSFRVTASFGIASAMRDIDPNRLLEEADAALYIAKRQGRDRCVMARASERRAGQSARRRVLKGGRILFDRRRCTRDCTIRGLSDHGATIDVTSIVGLPNVFELAIEAENVVRNCRIVKASERRLEVEFV